MDVGAGEGVSLDGERSVTWAAWDEDLLALELQEIQEADFDPSLTGFDPGEIDKLLVLEDEEKANAAPLPEVPVSRAGDLWILGSHRVLCGDCKNSEVVAKLRGDRKPRLMVADPPYSIELDSEWRDRAGLNGHGAAEPSYMKKRTKGHAETSGDSSDEQKWDHHPTQKPLELMRRPILNHLRRGELVYELFLGSGTTLPAAEFTEHVC